MVQKAVQQLLFDVDWCGADPNSLGLDILMIDMPPGTVDVPLSLGQLVNVDGMQYVRSSPHIHLPLYMAHTGTVIVSTPQNVALEDVRKSIITIQRLSIPVYSFLLSNFLCHD
jgi:ATP-binding protein involved in chromosome partitioning